ncbi:MAG: hypothetical protein AABX70_06865 [Nanoarchaeota archaeon]
MADANIFFTRIKGPEETRKYLLESSKSVISVLRGYYGIMKLREEKSKAITTLKNHFDELNWLFAKLDELLPQHSIEELERLLPDAKSVTQKARGMKEFIAEHDYKEIDKEIPEEIIEAVESPEQLNPASIMGREHRRKEELSLTELENALSSVEARLKELN